MKIQISPIIVDTTKNDSLPIFECQKYIVDSLHIRWATDSAGNEHFYTQSKIKYKLSILPKNALNNTAKTFLTSNSVVIFNTTKNGKTFHNIKGRKMQCKVIKNFHFK